MITPPRFSSMTDKEMLSLFCDVCGSRVVDTLLEHKPKKSPLVYEVVEKISEGDFQEVGVGIDDR